MSMLIIWLYEKIMVLLLIEYDYKKEEDKELWKTQLRNGMR